MSRAISGGGANYFSIADVPSVDLAGLTVTVAGWLHSDTVSGLRCITAKDSGGHGGCQYLLGHNNNMGYFQIGYSGNQYGIVGTIPFVTGTWVHFVGVQNGGGIYICTNGVQEGPASAGFAIENSANPLMFGRRGNGQDLVGRIADVALWNVVLTTAEILALAKGVSPALIRRSSLTGYWPFMGLDLATEVDLCGAANAAQVGTVPVSALRPPGGRWSAFAG
jgi:hypothetical protein